MKSSRSRWPRERKTLSRRGLEAEGANLDPVGAANRKMPQREPAAIARRCSPALAVGRIDREHLRFDEGGAVGRHTRPSIAAPVTS